MLNLKQLKTAMYYLHLKFPATSGPSIRRAPAVSGKRRLLAFLAKRKECRVGSAVPRAMDGVTYGNFKVKKFLSYSTLL